MRALPSGPQAVLLEVDDLEQAEELHAHLRERADRGGLDDITELVPGARTVLVVCRPGSRRLSGLVDELRDWSPTGQRRPPGPQHEIPVSYNGEDLPAVAEAAGLSIDEVIGLHSSADLHVAFCGFSPGFAYLAGLPSSLQLPRRPSPRTTVPAGSVAIAGAYTAVYPRASPGGWHLLGSTALRPWDELLDPPALLAPGDRVRFRPCPS